MMTYDLSLLRRAGRQALAGMAFITIGCVAANAQSPVTMATGVKGVSIIAPPPAGFNPITASASEREMYGVPPEPDPVRAPAANAAWQRSMANFGNRDTHVEVKQTNAVNGPNRPVGGVIQLGNNTVSVTSSNWSGVSLAASSGTPFAMEAILGIFVVPSPHVALGTCSGAEVDSSEWVGVDGTNGSNDVFQAGVRANAICNGGTTSADGYTAWVEWAPANEVDVNSPVISPGDLLLVEVWNTSSTAGNAFFHNISTGVTATYTFSAPNGTSLKGNSVEWIVERPEINGSFSTLMNYIDVAWLEGIAWNYKASSPTFYYMGGKNVPASITLQNMTMIDNNSKAISVTTIENTDFVWMQSTGSAYKD